MTVLGQGELLEPCPERSLSVSTELTWWGIDPSSKRVSLAWIHQDGERGVRTASFSQPKNSPARLRGILADTLDLAYAVAEQAPPAFVYVEQPGGKYVEPELWYAVGTIIAALATAAPEAIVETVTVSHWKKLALGRGDVYKPKKGDPRPYYTLVWAQDMGYAGRLWDEADAMGIAEAARRTVGLTNLAATAA